VSELTQSAFTITRQGYNEELEKRWIVRHGLRKKNECRVAEAVKPIVYYVDSGTRKGYSGSMIEGAAWWNQAFEAAGFRNAFQVRVLTP
jgi:hypothetical protein